MFEFIDKMINFSIPILVAIGFLAVVGYYGMKIYQAMKKDLRSDKEDGNKDVKEQTSERTSIK